MPRVNRRQIWTGLESGIAVEFEDEYLKFKENSERWANS